MRIKIWTLCTSGQSITITIQPPSWYVRRTWTRIASGLARLFDDEPYGKRQTSSGSHIVRIREPGRLGGHSRPRQPLVLCRVCIAAKTLSRLLRLTRHVRQIHHNHDNVLNDKQGIFLVLELRPTIDSSVIMLRRIYSDESIRLKESWLLLLECKVFLYLLRL